MQDCDVPVSKIKNIDQQLSSQVIYGALKNGQLIEKQPGATYASITKNNKKERRYKSRVEKNVSIEENQGAMEMEKNYYLTPSSNQKLAIG